MELEDFIEEYPPLESVDDFQSMLYAKREFREKEGEKTEPDPKSIGETFYRNQLLFIRIMTAYDVCLNISQAGTGKTCQAGGLAEYLKNNDPTIKKCYIITGNSLKSEFVRQMVHYCTGGVYLNDSIKNAKNEQSAYRAILNSMKPFFSFLTYGEFTKMMEETEEYKRPVAWVGNKWVVDYQKAQEVNSVISRDFSGCMFVFDEIHFQRIEGNIHGFKTVKGTNMRTPSDRMLKYISIWRLFHLMNRGKKLLFTATPVTNTGIEMLYLLNLLYPLDRQLKSDLMASIVHLSCVPGVNWIESPDWITPRDPQEMLNEYIQHFHENLNGRIMYTSENQLSAAVSYKPVPQPTISWTDPLSDRIGEWVKYANRIREQFGGKFNELERIRPVPMVGIQRDTYLQELTRNPENVDEDNMYEDEDDEEDETRSEVAYSSLRNICLGVFPDGGYTMKDAENWMVFDEKGIATIDRTKIYERNGIRGDLGYWFANHLYQLSAVANYTVTGLTRYPGKRFIPVTLVKGVGADYIGLAIESAIIIGPDGRPDPSKKFKRWLGEQTFKDENDNLTIEPDLRYAIVSSRVLKITRQNIYELYNHPQNWNGDYIKGIIVSEVGQTGISLLETMYADFANIPWSPGTMYQTEKRVIRVNAHNIHQRRNPKERPTVEVNILIPQLQNDDGSIVKDSNGNDIPTVSLKIYLRMVDRGRRNSLILRALKVNAADCCLQRKRNSLPQSMDGTPEADYMSANYNCYQCTDYPIDTSTYDVYYINSMIDKIKEIITLIFQTRSITNSQEIASMIHTENMRGNKMVKDITKYGPIKNKYISATLWTMIHQKVVFTDQFGHSCYVREDDGNFFLTRTEPRFDPYSDSSTVYYNSNIPATLYRNFDDVMSERITIYATSIIQRIEKASPDNLPQVFEHETSKADPIEIMDIVETLTAKHSKSIYNYILEYTSTNSWSKIPNDIPGLLVKKYYNVNLFGWNDPVYSIEKVSGYMASGQTSKISNTLYPEKKDGPPILLHNFYYYLPRKTMSGSSSELRNARFRIRVFKFKEGKWRDPTEAENWAYRRYFIDKSQKEESDFRVKFPRYYGQYLHPGEFKIRDVEHESSLSAIDPRFGRTGKVCKSYNALELLYYTWQLGIKLPDPHYSSASIESKRRDIIAMINTTKATKPNSLFDDVWVIESGKSNSVPDDFVEYAYGYLYQQYRAKKLRYDKESLCLMILENMVKTDRVFSPAGDPAALYFNLLDSRK